MKFIPENEWCKLQEINCKALIDSSDTARDPIFKLCRDQVEALTLKQAAHHNEALSCFEAGAQLLRFNL